MTQHDDTKLTHCGSYPDENKGAVNPPVIHASTIVHPTLAALDGREDIPYKYGRYGTDTARALKNIMTELEGGYDTILASSGMNAVSTAFLSFVRAGSHVLITDNCYDPVRGFADQFLANMGVSVDYYSPNIKEDELKALIRPTTHLIWMESPGSWTFEIQDVRMITALAKKHNINTVLDNTWGAGYYFKPLSYGVDVSLQAATKYIVGHSDALLGTLVCRDEKAYKSVAHASKMLGLSVAPDDIYLAIRGARTMHIRLKHHFEKGVELAKWLKGQKAVKKVLHPALEGDDYHDLWKRDFTGAPGLFGFVIDKTRRENLANMLDHMSLFSMGYSWGGFESLLIPTNPNECRTCDKWQPLGPGNDNYQTMRVHVGLENIDDLKDDLAKAFERLG